MPDRYSQRYGHICPDCFDELVSKGPDASYKEFMDSPKPLRCFEPDLDAARTRAESIFREST
jgi:hypothetical protein